jgi:hypothetical protein
MKNSRCVAASLGTHYPLHHFIDQSMGDNRHNPFDRKRWGVPSGRARSTHVLKMPVFCDKSFH